MVVSRQAASYDVFQATDLQLLTFSFPNTPSVKPEHSMAKTKTTRKPDKMTAPMPDTTSPKKSNYNLPDLRADKDLWYKILLLIYDHKNMTKDKSCENRTLQTTDALYISAPYFSAKEAAIVKSTKLDGSGITLEYAIGKRLENFFEKRRASGDWRPCGPHDMVPVYLECLGIGREEIEEEKFVSRVRRSGLGSA